MKYENLKTAAESITMPDEMKHRIAKYCKETLTASGKETYMNRNNHTAVFRKPAAVVAALLVLLSLSVTAVAAPDTMKGFFRDITNWHGAVVGTAYDQATDEIAVSTTANGNTLTVHAAIDDPNIIPYVYAEQLGIAQYRVEAENRKTVKKGATDSVDLRNGTANFTIDLDGLNNGSYNLIITAFVASAKAEQPLTINGNWECIFTK